MVVCSENAVGGILNWQISVLYGEKPMLVAQVNLAIFTQTYQIKITVNISAYAVCTKLVLNEFL